MPKTPEKPTSGEYNTQNLEIDKYVNRLSRRRQRRLGSMAIISLLAAPIAAYTSDVVHNYHELSDASMDITIRSEPLSEENSNSALVILNGFGTQHANAIAKYQGEALQNITDGSLYSVNYRNALLDHETIAKDIIEMAEENSLDRVSVVGYSAGGNTGADVALNLIKESDLDVPTIIFNLTPDGVNGLQPDKKKDLEFIDVIANIPGAKYSKHARFIVEMVVRLENNPGSDFWKTLDQTYDAVYNDKLPGFKLMMDQAMAIVESDIRSRLIEIGKIVEKEDKLKPVIIYLAAEPNSDYMVNNQLSSNNICGYAQEAGLECIIIEIQNILHNRPDISSEEYLKAILESSDKVNNALELAQAERDIVQQETEDGID
jgi:hypothetical protein